MKRFTLLCTFLICGLLQLKAQDTALQAAFSKSYLLEKNLNYTGAIDVLKPFYKEGNYGINIRFAYLNYEAAKYTESLSYYEKAIKLKPNAIEAHLGYTLPAAALNKWDDVINQYKIILAIEPKNSYVNYKLGYIYYYRKNYTEAHKHFEVTANLYPFDYSSVLMYGWASLELGKSQDARTCFERVLMMSPYDKSALEGLAMIK